MGKVIISGIGITVVTYILLAYASAASSEAKSFTSAWGSFAAAARGQ